MLKKNKFFNKLNFKFSKNKQSDDELLKNNKTNIINKNSIQNKQEFINKQTINLNSKSILENKVPVQSTEKKNFINTQQTNNVSNNLKNSKVFLNINQEKPLNNFQNTNNQLFNKQFNQKNTTKTINSTFLKHNNSENKQFEEDYSIENLIKKKKNPTNLHFSKTSNATNANLNIQNTKHLIKSTNFNTKQTFNTQKNKNFESNFNLKQKTFKLNLYKKLLNRNKYFKHKDFIFIPIYRFTPISYKLNFLKNFIFKNKKIFNKFLLNKYNNKFNKLTLYECIEIYNNFSYFYIKKNFLKISTIFNLSPISQITLKYLKKINLFFIIQKTQSFRNKNNKYTNKQNINFSSSSTFSIIPTSKMNLLNLWINYSNFNIKKTLNFKIPSILTLSIYIVQKFLINYKQKLAKFLFYEFIILNKSYTLGRITSSSHKINLLEWVNYYTKLFIIQKYIKKLNFPHFIVLNFSKKTLKLTKKYNSKIKFSKFNLYLLGWPLKQKNLTHLKIKKNFLLKKYTKKFKTKLKTRFLFKTRFILYLLKFSFYNYFFNDWIFNFLFKNTKNIFQNWILYIPILLNLNLFKFKKKTALKFPVFFKQKKLWKQHIKWFIKKVKQFYYIIHTFDRKTFLQPKHLIKQIAFYKYIQIFNNNNLLNVYSRNLKRYDNCLILLPRIKQIFFKKFLFKQQLHTSLFEDYFLKKKRLKLSKRYFSYLKSTVVTLNLKTSFLKILNYARKLHWNYQHSTVYREKTYKHFLKKDLQHFQTKQANSFLLYSLLLSLGFIYSQKQFLLFLKSNKLILNTTQYCSENTSLKKGDVLSFSRGFLLLKWQIKLLNYKFKLFFKIKKKLKKIPKKYFTKSFENLKIFKRQRYKFKKIYPDKLNYYFYSKLAISKYFQFDFITNTLYIVHTPKFFIYDSVWHLRYAKMLKLYNWRFRAE